MSGLNHQRSPFLPPTLRTSDAFHYSHDNSEASSPSSPLPVAHAHSPFIPKDGALRGELLEESMEEVRLPPPALVIRGLPLRPAHLALLVLVLHNSILVLILRASRIPQHPVDPSLPSPPLYAATSAVLFTELCKLAICFSVIAATAPRGTPLLRLLRAQVFVPADILRLALPSACYAVQNNLLYIALSNLEAATFQVVYQLKIFATAVFSIILLNRTLSARQWAALSLLMMGVTLVQLQTATQPHSSGSEDEASEGDESPILGFAAVILACLSSGFAGCYFERILKATAPNPAQSPSIWVRNAQLGVSATLFALIVMLFADGARIRQEGLFAGYGPLPWAVVINQAFGGLLVAAVVKYADNILKGFATSVSILLSGLISFLFLDFHPSLIFLLGASLVIISTIMYSRRS